MMLGLILAMQGSPVVAAALAGWTPGTKLSLEYTDHFAATDTSLMDVVNNDPFSFTFKIAMPAAHLNAAILSKKYEMAYVPGWRCSFSGDALNFAIADGTDSNSRTAPSLPEGPETTVVAVWSGSAWTVYYDGVAQSLTVIHSGTPGAATGNTEPLRIGRLGDETSSARCVLSQIALWSGTALAASDVAEIPTGTEDDIDLLTMTTPPDHYIPILASDTEGSGTGTLADLGTVGGLGMTSVVSSGVLLPTPGTTWATGYSFAPTTAKQISSGKTISGAFSISLLHKNVSKGDIGGTGAYTLTTSTSVTANSLGQLVIRVKDGTNYTQLNSPNGTISASTWQHILITCDGTGAASGIHVYVDGSEITCSVIRDQATGVYPGVWKWGTVNGNLPDSNICELQLWRSDQSSNAAAIYALAFPRADKSGTAYAGDSYLPIVSTDDPETGHGGFLDLSTDPPSAVVAVATAAGDIVAVSP